jgi:hypothetical protein
MKYLIFIFLFPKYKRKIRVVPNCTEIFLTTLYKQSPHLQDKLVSEALWVERSLASLLQILNLRDVCSLCLLCAASTTTAELFHFQ